MPDNILSNDAIAEIEVRAAKATKGPWKISNYRPYDILRRDPEESTYKVGDDKFSPLFHTCTWPPRTSANASFVAHSRQDIPDLIAHARALAAERDRLEKALKIRDPEIIRALRELAEERDQAVDRFRLKAVEAVKAKETEWRLSKLTSRREARERYLLQETTAAEIADLLQSLESE